MKTANELQLSCIKGEIAWREKHFGPMKKHCKESLRLLWVDQNAKTFRDIYDSCTTFFKVSFKPSWDSPTVRGRVNLYELNELLDDLGPDYQELSIVSEDK